MSTHKPHESLTAVQRVWRWLGITLFGAILGHYWLEPLTEPTAAGYLYKRAAEGKRYPRVRFIDVSHLYALYATEETEGGLPARVVKTLLAAIAELPRDQRPGAIGFDLPFLPESISGQGGGFALSEDKRQIIQAIMAFSKETRIPVRLVVPTFRFGSPGIEAAVPGIRPFLASSLTYQVGDIAPLWFGGSETTSALPNLGLAVARDGLRGHRSTGDTLRPAMGVQHAIEPPHNWPKELQNAMWAHIDYSILNQREALTVEAAGELEEGEELTPEAVFSEAAAEKLKGERTPMLWFIGVTQVPEREDIFAYDPHWHWLSEGEPVRRIYQHGAIAHTYLDAPLRHALFPLSVFLDLLCSACGLMMALLIDRGFRAPMRRNVLTWTGHMWGWLVAFLPYLMATVVRGFRRPTAESGGALVRVLGTPVACAIPIAVSFFVADYLRIFWFGFLGTLLYALIEPIIDGTLENR